MPAVYENGVYGMAETSYELVEPASKGVALNVVQLVPQGKVTLLPGLIAGQPGWALVIEISSKKRAAKNQLGSRN